MKQLKVKRILFATDFLESSRLALDYAVAFAHHFQATIVMLHVVELSQPAREAEAKASRPSLTRKAAQERLEALAAGVRRTGLEVTAIVESGIPCDVILQAVESHSADLLVLGIHGVHRGVEHLLIGSNTEKILLSACCPVMTVGAHVLAGIDLVLQLKEILYFTDFTPEAAAAAPYAAFLAKAFGIPVDVCQLAEDPSDTVSQFVPATNLQGSTRAFQLERGMEIDQIIDRAHSQGAGFIVLGVGPTSQLGRHLHTSFAYQLLAKATCPVVSIRSARG